MILFDADFLTLSNGNQILSDQNIATRNTLAVHVFVVVVVFKT